MKVRSKKRTLYVKKFILLKTISLSMRTVMRMRPKKVFIGELANTDTAEFLIKINTGHEGFFE
ncbi:ATPase, T2SS/T4P/T4SS family [Undibacterium sp. RTI2.2]|uniref:ATPase, T2SS/T4P/T4SS family n=1 Tax=unclassified Undibacterium TaxID=2630295 RepID=UPI003A599D13